MCHLAAVVKIIITRSQSRSCAVNLTSNLYIGLKPSSQLCPLVRPSTKRRKFIGMFHIHPVTCKQVCVAPVCTTYVRLSSCLDNVNISSRFPIFHTPITVSLFGIASYNILLSKALSLSLSFETSHTRRRDDAKARGNILPPLP